MLLFLSGYLLDIVLAQFFHVDSRLFEADKRRSNPCVHLFALMCPETDNSSGMVSCLFGNVFLKIAIGYCCFVCERLVELDDKVILEVFGNSSAIAGGIADNLVFLRNHFDIRAFVESVHYDIRMFIFRESEGGKGQRVPSGPFPSRCHVRRDILYNNKEWRSPLCGQTSLRAFLR